MGRNERVRSELSAEIRRLANILDENIGGFDSGPLRSAAQTCESAKPAGRDSWGYEVTALQFSGYEPSRRIRPPLAQAADITVELDIGVVGSCRIEEEDLEEDPLNRLQFDLVLWNRDEDSRYTAAWHLDRHVSNEDDPMYRDHPAYHFQFGGNRLLENVANYGEVLVPEPPRLVHPPLDAILACNFVLANFFPSDWQRLSDESEYTRLVGNSQRRLWKPYAEAVANAWEPGPLSSQPWPPLEIWPQLVDNYEPID